MSQKGGTYHRPSSGRLILWDPSTILILGCELTKTGWGRAPQPRDQEVKDEEPVIDKKTGDVDEKTGTVFPILHFSFPPFTSTRHFRVWLTPSISAWYRYTTGNHLNGISQRGRQGR
jgi:hypothetical protein